MKGIPKVLVSCPTSDRHSHLLERWIDHLNSLTYPNFEVLLVDTSLDKGEYYKYLKKLKVHKKINVIRLKWNPEKRHILQHLADARENIRQYALRNNFDFLFFCFQGDTQIETINGAKKIKNIEIGELVKTHDGEYRRVTKIYKRKYHQKNGIIWVRAGRQLIKNTPEHPYYVLRDNCFQWIHAKNLLSTDKLAYPIKIKEDFINFDCHGRGRKSKIRTPGKIYKKNSRNKNFKVDYYGDYLVDKDLARFFGLYLAEGCRSSDGIRFTFNNNELEYIDFIKEVCEKKFNRTPTIDKRWATTVKLNIKEFSKRFSEWFGINARVKKIPDFVYDWNDINKASFLRGYLEGDGHFNNSGSCSYITASKDLDEGIKLLSNSLGLARIKTQIVKPLKVILKSSKREIKSQGGYQSYINQYSTFKILDLCDGEIFGNYLLVNANIEHKKNRNECDVYNLEVEDKHTYTANGIAVHNCDDDIFVPKNSIQKLISRNKELVGFYVHIYNPSARVPCVQKEGGFEVGKGCYWFNFAEINEYKKFIRKYKKNELTLQEKHLIPFIIKDRWRPDIVPVWAVGIGCLMIRKEVLEKVPFTTHDTFIWGEDNWFFQACEDKKFQFWLDTSVRAIHKNTNWNMISAKCRQNTRMVLAIGPTNAKGNVLLRGKK